MGSPSKRSPRRWSFEGLIPECWSVACCAYAPAPSAKKNTGRRPILWLVLATRGDVLCNMLADRGANKSDCSGLGSSTAEWSILPAGGELMRPKLETRSVLQRAVSSARTPKVSSLWSVPGDQQEGPKAETRSVLRTAVSSARTSKVSSVWYVSGDQHEGPMPFHCVVDAVVEARALPPLRSHPRRNRGCGLDGKRKQIRYRKNIGKIEGTLLQWQRQALDDAICKAIGGDTEYPLQACQLSKSSESAHFLFLRRDAALSDSTRAPDSF